MTGVPPATLRKSRRFMGRPTLRPFGERNEVDDRHIMTIVILDYGHTWTSGQGKDRSSGPNP